MVDHHLVRSGIVASLVSIEHGFVSVYCTHLAWLTMFTNLFLAQALCGSALAHAQTRLSAWCFGGQPLAVHLTLGL